MSKTHCRISTPLSCAVVAVGVLCLFAPWRVAVAQALVSGDVPTGRTSNKQRTVFYNGENFLLDPPPTELVVGLESLMPAALVVTATDIAVGTLSMSNAATPGSGSITVDYVRFRAADASFATASVGAVASRIKIYAAGSLIGQSDSLSADSTNAYVAFASPLVIPPGNAPDMEIRMDLQASTGAATFRVGFDDVDVGVEQPASALFRIRVEPENGQSFPMWTQPGTFSVPGLGASYSNFPNPFAAGKEVTTFVYYLRADAKVALKVWTARGEPVATIREGTFRAAGLHQDDRWDGRNGTGLVVVNGVYIAELVVRYTDGKTDRMLRKVAVVR